MSKKMQLAETRRRIAELETKLSALKASKTVKENSKYRTNLARLIESELDKASVIMACQAVVDKLTKMIEDAARQYGEEVVPLMDSLKEAFGPEMAENFRNVAQNQLNAATTALTQVKDALGGEVSKLEGVLSGGPVNDMGADDFGDLGASAPVAPGAPAPDGGMEPPAGEEGVGADMRTDPNSMDAPMADTGEADMDAAFDDLDTSSPAGRAKKESAQPRGKVMREGKTADKLDSERKKIGKKPVSKNSRALNDFLDDEEKDGKKKSVKEGEFVPGKKGVNPFAKKDNEKKKDEKETNDCEDKDDDCDVKESRKSTAVKALAESKNPDALIFNAFRKAIREGHSPVRAAKAIANVFAVDFADVVQIVREARGK